MLFTTYVAVGFSANILAWGHDGHAAVGILALGQLPVETRIKLEHILGSIDNQTIVEACNWPDTVRESNEWAWTYPLHYINIPKQTARYSKARDCPDQLCVTEAIKKYARQLGDQQASLKERQQAFAFICHFTGDLHQPLHAAYSGEAYDRGGNEFEITFNSEQMNLHNFWDRALIKARADNWQQLINVLSKYPMVETSDNWSPVMIDQWTEESHQLLEQEIYPQDPEITALYADGSWDILQQRIITAAARLALIVNTVLQD